MKIQEQMETFQTIPITAAGIYKLRSRRVSPSPRTNIESILQTESYKIIK
jgi:hypothetical protein